jgi:hypothetical protein
VCPPGASGRCAPLATRLPRTSAFARATSDHRPNHSTHLGCKSRHGWHRAKTFTRLHSSANTASLLSRPASFCENQPPRVGSAPKQACQFEGLVTFQAWGHQARKLQDACGKGVPIKPVSRALCFFAHRSRISCYLVSLGTFDGQDSGLSGVIPGLDFYRHPRNGPWRTCLWCKRTRARSFAVDQRPRDSGCRTRAHFLEC